MKSWLIKVTKWEEKSKHEKRAYKARIIGSLLFICAGIVAGIVSAYLQGWDFIKFITNPTTDLIILLCFAVGIFLLVYKGNRKDIE